MAAMRMMQGDSYSIPFTITMNDSAEVTPDIISELELCIGNENGASIRKTFSAETVWFDDATRQWFFRPTQQETLRLEPGNYSVIARMKFNNDDDSDVIGVDIGRITIVDTQSEEVI